MMSEKIMKDKYYAHSIDGKPPEDWHRLEDHLNEVLENGKKTCLRKV